MGKEVFIVGKVDKSNYLINEIIGVFEDERDALIACRTVYHYIFPIEINKDFGDAAMINTKAYYPLSDKL